MLPSVLIQEWQGGVFYRVFALNMLSYTQVLGKGYIVHGGNLRR